MKKMSCSFCDQSISEEDYELFHTCYYCDNIVCDDCSSVEEIIRCDCCNENVCSGCYPSLLLTRECKRCEMKNICENCLTFCGECRETCCKNCLFENDVCEKCFFEINDDLKI